MTGTIRVEKEHETGNLYANWYFVFVPAKDGKYVKPRIKTIKGVFNLVSNNGRYIAMDNSTQEDLRKYRKEVAEKKRVYMGMHGRDITQRF